MNLVKKYVKTEVVSVTKTEEVIVSEELAEVVSPEKPVNKGCIAFGMWYVLSKLAGWSEFVLRKIIS